MNQCWPSFVKPYCVINSRPFDVSWSGKVYKYYIHVEAWQKIKNPWKQGSWGQHGAHLGTTGPRWAPYWPHEPWYLGYLWGYFVMVKSYISMISCTSLVVNCCFWNIMDTSILMFPLNIYFYLTTVNDWYCIESIQTVNLQAYTGLLANRTLLLIWL